MVPPMGTVCSLPLLLHCLPRGASPVVWFVGILKIHQEKIRETSGKFVFLNPGNCECTRVMCHVLQVGIVSSQ